MKKEFSEKTTERFIAYFDIMGFKDLVYRNNHDEVKKLMDKVSGVTKMIESNQMDKMNKYIAQPTVLTGITGKSENDSEKAFVLPVVFSDSILFMSNSNSESDANLLIKITSVFLYGLLCKYEVPIKGALSYGRFTADFEKSIFFGRPLIDAYSLADEVHFYGAVLHNTFDSYVNKNKIKIESEALKRAKVPMKSRDITHSYLDWRIFVDKDKDGDINSIMHKFYDGVSGNTRSYVDNTMKLFGIK